MRGLKIIFGSDLAEMRSLSSANCGAKYLLLFIDIFTKYAWVKPLEDKKAKTVLNSFIQMVNKSERQPKKLRVD